MPIRGIWSGTPLAAALLPSSVGDTVGFTEATSNRCSLGGACADCPRAADAPKLTRQDAATAMAKSREVICALDTLRTPFGLPDFPILDPRFPNPLFRC